MQYFTAEQLNQDLNPEQGAKLWPTFNQTELSRDGAKLDFFMDPEIAYFSGHFPEQAVLPGVVQVHWAGELARRLFACSGFSTLSKIKFNNAILPNTRLSLSLSYLADVGRVEFCYEDSQQKLSSGVLSFQGET